MSQQRSCWGEFDFPKPAVGRWRIGPLTVWVERTENEWRIGMITGDDASAPGTQVELPISNPGSAPPDELIWERFSFSKMPSRIVTRPRVADRPVVSHPEMPVTIPPRQSGRFFVGSPTWIELSVPTVETPLLDVPIWRPSDTWFGSPTSGTLCYATRTRLRRVFENLPPLHYRIASPIVIENLASTALVLERLSIPVPNLSVYVTGDGFLWTEEIHLKREESNELGFVSLGTGPPSDAGQTTKISGPRTNQERMFVSRLFGELFE